MFKGFSMKSKIIIFIISAIIGFRIIISTAIKNRENIKNYRFGENVQISADKNMKIDEDEPRQKQEEERIKQQDAEAKIQKQKELEQKYENAYKSFQGRKYYDAINISDEIINSDNKFYKAYNIKGIALCYSGNYLDGMSNIDKSLEIKPEYGYARFNKALALELYGKYDDSLQWYDKALEVENYIWSYYGKASIYGRYGDVVDTVKYLKIAIEMDASIKNIASEEQDFDNVRKSKEFQELIK